MIATTDIANIIYRDCEAFGIEIVPMGRTITGELISERITIHTKSQQPGTIWKEGFVEVNFCVPNLRDGDADTIRLNKLERQAISILGDNVGQHDNTSYHYSINQIGIENDSALKCHFVNVKILFQVLNTN